MQTSKLTTTNKALAALAKLPDAHLTACLISLVASVRMDKARQDGHTATARQWRLLHKDMERLLRRLKPDA